MSLMLVILSGAILVIPLAIYAAYLAYQLVKKKSKERELSEKVNSERLEGDKDARQSIQIISRALLQKDLSETEAAMRIAFLAQKLTPSADEATALLIFQQLAEATAHIPILEDWNALERTEKRRLTVEREGIESTYSEFVQDSAAKLSKIRLV